MRTPRIGTAVELQRIVPHLRMIARLSHEVVQREALRRRRLEHVFALGEHVRRDDVRPRVVVEVGRVHAHRRPARVPHRRGADLRKRAIAVVVVQKIVFLKVVRDVQVGAAIAIEVARHHTEPIAEGAAVDAGRGAHVHEVAMVVAIQPVARAGIARGARRRCARAVLRVHRVIEQVHVEVAVAVVIEEQRLCGVALELQSILRRPIGEGAVAIVDIQHIAAVNPQVAHPAHEDVHVAVAVHVGHRDTSLPARRIGDARAHRDVLELIVSLVQVQMVGPEIRREVEVGQSVVVDVAYRNAAAVVVVQIVEDVEARVLGQFIRER